MSRIKALLFLSVILFTLSSCAIKPDDIRFNEITDLRIEGVTMSQAKLNLAMEVANDSRVKVTVRDGSLLLSDSRGAVAELNLNEAIVLPKRTVSEVSFPVILRSRDPLGLMGSVSRLNGDIDLLRISGSVRLKGGSMNRTFRFDEMPVRQFLEMIGVNGLNSLNLSF